MLAFFQSSGKRLFYAKFILSISVRVSAVINQHQAPTDIRRFSKMPVLRKKDVPFFLHLVSATTQIASTAGCIARNVVQTGKLGIVDKGGGDDPQTIADRAIQTYVVQKLHQHFPKLTVIGEEGENALAENDSFDNLVPSSSTRCVSDKLIFPEILELKIPDNLRGIKEEDVVIWLDPLDGTKEFTIGGLGHVTTLLGIAHDGHPVAGVIHEPFSYLSGTGRTIYGIPGVGYGGVQLILTQKGKRLITTSKSHSNHRIESAIAILKPYRVIRAGGAGHKTLYLVEGVANAYVFASKGLKKWDTCAPEAVLKAVGGKLTDLSGGSYRYSKDADYGNDGGLLATAPGEDHDWYIKQLLGAESLVL